MPYHPVHKQAFPEHIHNPRSEQQQHGDSHNCKRQANERQKQNDNSHHQCKVGNKKEHKKNKKADYIAKQQRQVLHQTQFATIYAPLQILKSIL